MSKYTPLWEYIAEQKGGELILSFTQIEEICVFPIDHSFLNYKKELLAYGWQVKKISMKQQTVALEKRKG